MHIESVDEQHHEGGDDEKNQETLKMWVTVDELTIMVAVVVTIMFTKHIVGPKTLATPTKAIDGPELRIMIGLISHIKSTLVRKAI